MSLRKEGEEEEAKGRKGEKKEIRKEGGKKEKGKEEKKRITGDHKYFRRKDSRCQNTGVALRVSEH